MIGWLIVLDKLANLIYHIKKFNVIDNIVTWT